MLGVLLIDKPKGPTSHDVVNAVRREFGIRRVGHAGTLDPMATGLLVVAVGPATRFLQYLQLEPKVYAGEATFGVETTTQDAEGQVVAESPLPEDLDARIAQHVPALQGEIVQIPPAFSSVKLAGRPLYDYARKGQDVQRAPRRVYVQALDFGAVAVGRATFETTCSGGTYVRTLVHDLGRMVSCGAHLSALRRTRAGRFAVDQASELDAISTDALIPLRQALDPMPEEHLTEVEAQWVGVGRRIPIKGEAAFAMLLDPEGRVVGIGRRIGNERQPECVLPREETHAPL